MCLKKHLAVSALKGLLSIYFFFGWNEMCVESLIWCVCSRPTTWTCMAVSTSGSSQDGTRGTGGNRRTPQTAPLRSFWQPWMATSAWILSLSVPNRWKEYQEKWVSAMRWDFRSYEWHFWFLTEKKNPPCGIGKIMHCSFTYWISVSIDSYWVYYLLLSQFSLLKWFMLVITDLALV